MKTLFRVTMLGLLMVIFTAVSVSPIVAQTQEEKTAVYNKFVAHFDKETIKDREIALAAAKEYNEKFTKEEDKQYNDYFAQQIKYLNEWITFKKKDDEAKILAAQVDKEAKETQARLTKFNTAIQAAVKTATAENWNEVFTAGDAIISNDKEYAEYLKRILPVAGSRYLVQAETPIDTYNNKIIGYAEQAIQYLNSNELDNKAAYKNLEFKDKETTLAKLNIIIGNIKANRQGKKEDGIAYYYRSLDTDKNWDTYRIVGDWYFEKVVEIGKKRTALDQKDEANIQPIRDYAAMEKGYAARAIDAYARSYSLAKSDPKVNAAAKTTLYDILKKLFEFRYNEVEDASRKTEIGINSYVATVSTKNMPNPASDIEPIKSHQELREERERKAKEDKEAKANETKSPDMKKDDATKKDGASVIIKKDAKSPVKTNGATRSRTVSKKAKDN